MFQLSEQQIDIIYGRLQKEGLSNRKLEQDLFDHFCCYMEERIEHGVDFENAYDEAVAAIYPNGAKEIEFELYFIMTFNKQLSMKRLIFFLGFLAAFLLSTGTMFKTMYWPGASVILVTGFAMALLTVLASAILLIRFLHNRSLLFWCRSITGLVAVSLISVGFMFKIFHFPGASILYAFGTVTLNFVFLPMLFYHFYKHGFLKTSLHESVE